MRRNTLSLLVVGWFGVSGAQGVVTPIGPFSGLNEDFESMAPGSVGPPSSPTAGPASVFGGFGTLTGTTTVTINPLYVWNSTGGLSLGSYGTAVPYDGIQGLVLNPYGTSPFGRIDFTSPVQDFGGYWAHAAAGATAGPITVSFFDSGGGLIDTDSWNYNSTLAGVLEWKGWTSTTPIAAVEFEGFWTTMDGLQVRVPGAGTGVALALAGAGALRRRRRGDGARPA